MITPTTTSAYVTSPSSPFSRSSILDPLQHPLCQSARRVIQRALKIQKESEELNSKIGESTPEETNDKKLVGIITGHLTFMIEQAKEIQRNMVNGSIKPSDLKFWSDCLNLMQTTMDEQERILNVFQRQMAAANLLKHDVNIANFI